MKRADLAQLVGALILCASIGLRSIWIGGAVFGLLVLAYGVAYERQNMETDEDGPGTTPASQ